MQEDKKLLQIVTDETKNSLEDLNVVTPAMYEALFSKYASKHKIPIEGDSEIINHIIDERISQLVDMQSKTSDNAKKLSDNTDKAITAIQAKDDKILAEVLKETQKLREEIKILKESMYKDELTHVYNRRWLHDNVLNEDGHGFKGSGTLAIIDLNYFKEINDTYGHTIGDKVLIFIASQLKTTQESVVRYGGDEFIIMFCDGITQETALSKLNAIRDDILKKHMKVKDASFKVSFSIGAHEFNKGDNLNDVIEKADKNMYNDKIDIKKIVPGIN